MGGESRSSLIHDRGYSDKAQCIGNPRSYLEPNSGSLHVPIEEAHRASEKIEERGAIGEKHNQNHVEKAARTYLEPIRNRMQKPIECLLAQLQNALNKEGGGLISERNSSTKTTSRQHESTQKHTQHSTATRSIRKDPIYKEP